MTVDELKSKIEILVALNAQLAKRLAEAGRPSREDHWERKCREHLAEVHALRSKVKALETEQGLHALRAEVRRWQATAERRGAELRAERARADYGDADPVAFRVFTPEEIAERWRNGLQPKQLSAEEIAALIERIDRR